MRVWVGNELGVMGPAWWGGEADSREKQARRRPEEGGVTTG